MPTIMTHAIVPLMLGAGAGMAAVPRRLLAAGAVLAIVPDLDVIAFPLGVPYGTAFGHRGFSHSLMLAGAVAMAGTLAWRWFRSTPARVFLFLFVSMASHGLLDACTNGGSGIALLWPFSGERFFAPVTPIEVSPIGLARFLSARGATVLESEMRWVWLPCAAIALATWGVRRARAQSRRSSSTG